VRMNLEMYFDSVKVAYTIHHTPYIVALYKYLRKTEIYKNGGYTKEDLQYNQYNDDPFKSFSVRRIDTLLEELEHILENLRVSRVQQLNPEAAQMMA
jgi:hypothetical protein